MIDERVGRAILRFVQDHRGRVSYREIRTSLAENLGVTNELVLWNEVMELVRDSLLDNGGIIPGDRDRLAVLLTSAGRNILNDHDADSISFDPLPGGPELDRDPKHDLGPKDVKPKILEW